MSTVEKAMELYSIVVNDSCCLWEIFQENVKTQGDADFRRKLKNCNSRAELTALVNQYI